MGADATGLDETSELAEEALAQLRARGLRAEPRFYAVWYTHLTGRNAALSRALTDAVARGGGQIDEADIERLHELYLSTRSAAALAEQASQGLIAEIDNVMDMIDTALGSSVRYGESLAALSEDLTDTVDRARIREILSGLVLATRDAVATTKSLESRLSDSRGEIQHLRETLEEIRSEALTDALTGLANRKHLDGMLLQSVDQASVNGESLAVLIIDIDRFKTFNDSWGHMTGDQVLRLVAMSIKSTVRPTDTAARFGGEEFVIILPRTSLDGARLVAERIRKTVMGRELVKRSTGESLGRVTVSIGVSCFRRGDTALILLERADRCLNVAKRAGRNRTVLESDLPGHALAVA